MLPAHEEQPQAPPEPPPSDDEQRSCDSDRPLEDQVVAAALAAMPAGLLDRLRHGLVRGSTRSPGRAGAVCQTTQRGRPVGVRRGVPRAGVRLDLVATLRSAAPWQPLRRSVDGTGRIQLRPDDFRLRRFKQRKQTTTIFAVDASGSSALHRLAEAKGAVELMLAECYVRRDQVALLAFRGARAELLLPPTRSLARAKRSLASLPGGGGTPLAAGIDAAAALADTIRRRGDTPVVMLLTDGRANVARNGSGGREPATRDAIAAAGALRAAGLRVILVDTSPRPQPAAEHLAAAMDALYLPLPYADATVLSQAVRSATSVQRAA
jgi:magnesium chelatase subunit D